MDSSRTFVAVELDASATGILERRIKQFKTEVEGVKWSRRDQMHLTLKFLGDIDHRELPEVCMKLREATVDVEPFTVELKGLGTFPKDKPPRVVWAAVEEGAQPLRLLHERLDTALAGLGIPHEARAYTPHLTLGRVGGETDLEKLQQVIDAVGTDSIARCQVDAVVLLTTIKDRGQVSYEPLDVVEL